jgi:dipeptidyl aminopeptidase/acylaminoacyl peptidase
MRPPHKAVRPLLLRALASPTMCRSIPADSPPLVAITVIPSAGGPPLKTFQVPEFIGRLRWSPNGRAIDYLLTQNNATNIWEQQLSETPPKQLTKFDAGQIVDFSWSRDGRRILMTRGQTTRDGRSDRNFSESVMPSVPLWESSKQSSTCLACRPRNSN